MFLTSNEDKEYYQVIPLLYDFVPQGLLWSKSFRNINIKIIFNQFLTLQTLIKSKAFVDQFYIYFLVNKAVANGSEQGKVEFIA